MGEIAESNKTQSPKILCVDLDGTLIKSDLFYESILKLFKKDLKAFFYVLLSLVFKGRAKAKHLLAEKIPVDPQLVPLNTYLFDYLLHEKKSGRKLILVTASPTVWAKEISDHLNAFQEVIASTETFNCKGKNKLKAIREHIGDDDFEYVGNDYSDLDIWKESEEITVVSADMKLIRKAAKFKKPKYVFDQGLEGQSQALFKSLRPHQWSKNCLLIVPALMAHQFSSPDVWIQIFTAICSFSLVASAVYLLNDLMDLDADRLHPIKKNRPLASGRLDIRKAFLILPFIFIAGFVIAFTLPFEFFVTLLVYFSVTSAYSFYLKQVVVLDILVLAFLYSLRILGGGTATAIFVSPWLIAFSVFFFLSLASLKRYIEILKTAVHSDKPIAGRGYCASDQPIILQAGMTSGVVAVLVMALYLNSSAVVEFYSNQEVLWLFCPLLLYWILRIWILANRGLVNDDPVLYAIKDKTSYLVLALSCLVLYFAI